MSDLAFPKPAGLGWSVDKIPEFRTGHQPVASGKEVRIAYWAMPRWEFRLRWEYLKDWVASPYSDLRTLAGFFLARLGSFDSFLFEDSDDRGVTLQNIGTGNGSNKDFQLVRNFGGFIEVMQSPAGVGTIPLQAATPGNVAPLIYVDGVLKTLTTDYTISSTGLVTFVTAPLSTKAVTATFGYYFRVRFKLDIAEFEQFAYQLWTLRSLDLVGIKL